MISRNNQIKLIQIFLLIISLLIIFYTYFDNQIKQEGIISPTDKKRIKTDVASSTGDIFYNIKYSGIDLSGNRYVLTSKEALVDESSQEIVTMNYVNAIFYFKDNTKLIIDSDEGLYNNKTLDMIFEKNVIASYEDSKLFGEKIIYLNKEKTLEVLDNVKLVDVRGSMSADKLLFDLETKKLEISSHKSKINTNINLK